MSFLALALAGCVGAGRTVQTSMRPPAWDARSERALSLSDVAASLDAVQAIYVGEHHDRAADHEAQLRVLQALHARDPSLAIGMEMFQAPFQAALDAYVAGDLDEAGMLDAVEWSERWGMDFALYRPLLEFARTNGLRVIALNARQELTRAVVREGLEGLSEALRSGLPELVLDDAAHRAMVAEALAGHGAMDPARMERFYVAQVVWDETMAARIAETMAAPEAPRRIVVFAGRMHVERGLGIPRRAARRGVTSFRVLLPSLPDEVSDDRAACDVVLPIVDVAQEP